MGAETGDATKRVLVSESLADSGLAILKGESDIEVHERPGMSPEQLLDCIGDYDALLIRSETQVTDEVIAKANRLKVVGRAGVGIDNVDLKAATRRGIIVMNSPTGNTIAAAEHTMTMMLALSRNIAPANASLLSGEWDRSPFVGVELYRKTLGTLGLGRVGSEVVRRARAFGMNVIADDPYVSQSAAERLGVSLAPFDELLTRSDYITAHVPLTRETRHRFGAAEFARMKPGVRIVNCARGGVFDEDALHDALASGHVAGAALDVYESEPEINTRLVELPTVLATPHLGASTKEAQANISIDIAKQVMNALRGRPVENALNMPSVDAATLEVLGPYISLAEKLGSLQTQIIGDATIEEVGIEYSGGLFEMDVAPITTALQKGMLQPALGDMVNFVNAPLFFEERGIRLTETRTSRHDAFSNLLTVRIGTGFDVRVVAGTVAGGQQRLVMIDDYHCSATPEGPMLLVFNNDAPGMIGRVGTLLGKHQINIADMGVGRVGHEGRAVMMVSCDAPVARAVLDEIATQEGIITVRYAVLPT
ncbi:phosphoglycerate dehydrogenase [Candidatus Poribacteria bacterium]|nr:phosphoglycerate dehydrogenase [Candidatus Poribacteria bacterium]